MKVYTIEVNANFVTEALQARYDEVEHKWGGVMQAHHFGIKP